MESPAYLESVAALRDLVKANPDIAFIYVMRREQNKAVFVLDSDADDPAVPGEVYPHEVPARMEGFVRPSVDYEIITDRWGSFLSGYSPLKVENGAYFVVTGSFGVTRFVLGEGLDSCLKRTDDALYAAKAQGRNRIVAMQAKRSA